MSEMFNRYDGYVPQWKVDLALSRIKAFNFPPDQWPDLLQDIMQVIADLHFQPELANGRNEAQLLYGLINNHLSSALRTQYREQLLMQRYHQHLGLSPEKSQADHPHFTTEDHPEIQLDLQTAIATLSPHEQQICQKLMQGVSVHEIARETGIGWHSIETSIRKIRELFTELELDAWIL